MVSPMPAHRLRLLRRRPQHDLRDHRGGARSAADIGAKLKAGTNCGSCIPELKRLIAQTGTSDAGQRKLAAAN